MGWESHVVLRFVVDGTDRGPVMGYEAYTLDEDLCHRLVDPDEMAARPRWYLCAGTPGRWDACHVDSARVADYLMEVKPAMFPDMATVSGPSPGR